MAPVWSSTSDTARTIAGIWEAVQTNNPDELQRLIREDNGNINIISESGRTPLFFATVLDYPSVVRVLLAAGALGHKRFRFTPPGTNLLFVGTAFGYAELFCSQETVQAFETHEQLELREQAAHCPATRGMLDALSDAIMVELYQFYSCRSNSRQKSVAWVVK